MSKDLPALTGPALIKLLQENGWQTGRRANHGRALTKWSEIEKRILVTFIPEKPRSLPRGTLLAILRETKLGRDGLLELLEKDK
jgi:predicted RNA binding protein YcfA (HicA-like mRNA interferase family)